MKNIPLVIGLILVILGMVLFFYAFQNQSTPTSEIQKADLAFNARNYKTAILLYQPLLDKDSSNVTVRLKLAYSFQQIGNFKNAYHEYKRAFTIGVTKVIIHERHKSKTFDQVCEWVVDVFGKLKGWTSVSDKRT